MQTKNSNEKTICYNGVNNNKNNHHTKKEAFKIAQEMCKTYNDCPKTNDISTLVHYLGASYISKKSCDQVEQRNKLISKLKSKINTKNKKYLDKIKAELKKHSSHSGVPVEEYPLDVLATIIASKCGDLANEIYILELEIRKINKPITFL